MDGEAVVRQGLAEEAMAGVDDELFAVADPTDLVVAGVAAGGSVNDQVFELVMFNSFLVRDSG